MTRITRRDLLEGSTALALAGLTISGNADASAPRGESLLDGVELEMRVTRNFLASWFAGRVEKPRDPVDFYLQGVVAKDFHIIRPNGIRLDRQQTLSGFYNKLYGSEPEVLRHDNDNIITIMDTDTVVVVSYDEGHVYPDHVVVNAVTAIFVKDNHAPNGVSWLLVHETPIKEEK